MSLKTDDHTSTPNDATPALDPVNNKSAPNGLEEWTVRVLRNMTRMATDEDYRREIAKKLS